ncbi:hypothetical protein EF847_12330 [Actinobacteria bacterium YIM 96077]|uniref:Transporter n=2 Tax=Phytoactinopolyspora halophila TaxID=1981511 RepID=A0A329QZ43_9ACTN|nr:hypothetical protein EF847_12330 [Actinobacteria bacterium YIM 96077]RAW17403.1 hypothetical protein DPM12_05105 [Phytoactinopolyspora halophila]
MVENALAVITGLAWTVAYLGIIHRGFRDKTYGMPLTALALNITWEFIFAFLVPGRFGLQVAINVVWFCFDVVILYTYFAFGRKEFPASVHQRWFIPWGVLLVAISFVTQYSAAREFPDLPMDTYTAFVVNVIMSVAFITMLARRGSRAGQSLVIATSKWLGSAAVTVLVFLDLGSSLLLTLGVCVFVLDVIYIVMLARTRAA